ncbi:predicted protein [Chaetoceros tenuissimus]|uniref:WW domain-containing protein n=1 Tax=Chaetoceros tenuissimus TaxID=426638 RepID=A0AAD3H944_9STRA|nr:predicted protein [Chaetoceros tenuissimus]
MDVLANIKFVDVKVSGLTESFVPMTPTNDNLQKNVCKIVVDPESYQELRKTVFGLLTCNIHPTIKILSQYSPLLVHRFNCTSLEKAIVHLKKEFRKHIENMRIEKSKDNIRSKGRKKRKRKDPIHRANDSSKKRKRKITDNDNDASMEYHKVVPNIAGNISTFECKTSTQAKSKEEKAIGAITDGYSLPRGWTERIDKTSGRPYYFHAEEEIAQWERPLSPEEKMRLGTSLAMELFELAFSTEQVDPPTNTDYVQISTTDEKIEKELVSWFADVVMKDHSRRFTDIWNDYARNFVELGFYSIEMIKEICSSEPKMIDGPDFSWMLLCHRQGLKAWLQLL